MMEDPRSITRVFNIMWVLLLCQKYCGIRYLLVKGRMSNIGLKRMQEEVFDKQLDD